MPAGSPRIAPAAHDSRTVSAERELIPDAVARHTTGPTAIFLTVLSINLVGDGLRDALDPRQR
jgi:ABC-type dipeptide/oligopeptide/nickel transport system permease subunit